MSALKRIEKELKDIKSGKLKNLDARPIDEKDLFNWRATIVGPDDSPYKGGIFHLKIRFPMEYPFRPPEFKFITKIYHYNINPSGVFYFDYLYKNWSPSFSIGEMLNNICSLLSKPNFDIPAFNGDAHQLYSKNQKEYYKKARDWSIKYANAPINNLKFNYSLKGKDLINYELNNIKYGENIKLTLTNNIYLYCQLKAIIKMPKDTPYEGEEYELLFNIPEDYPSKPPSFSITFPDEYMKCAENLCKYILEKKWNRKLSIKDIIILIIKSLKYNFINNIIKEDELEERINILEDSLNKEKIENKNLTKNNENLNIKLKETEEILNNFQKVNLNLNKKINELEKLIQQNNFQIKNLKKIISEKDNKLSEKKNLMTIIISTFDEGINFSFICENTDKFKKIEEAFYNNYPEYIKIRSIFTIRQKEIDVNKSIEDNNIRNNDIIILKKLNKNDNH